MGIKLLKETNLGLAKTFIQHLKEVGFDLHNHGGNTLKDVRVLWGAGAGRGVLAGYVPLTSQSPYPIIVYSVAIFQTPSQSLLGKYVIFAIPTQSLSIDVYTLFPFSFLISALASRRFPCRSQSFQAEFNVIVISIYSAFFSPCCNLS